MRKEQSDLFEADGRTAWVWRNGTKTQKRMFDSEDECAAWVKKMNAKKPGNVDA